MAPLQSLVRLVDGLGRDPSVYIVIVDVTLLYFLAAKYAILHLIYVTGFGKTRLIAGVRNSSYSPFSRAKLIFVDFLFSSKIKNMTLMLYVHTIIILGKLYKS